MPSVRCLRLWLRASRGHPGWPCRESTVATFPWKRKVCLSSVGSRRRYPSQACGAGLADRSVCVCDFQPRLAPVQGICKPFFFFSPGTPPCFHASDLIYQMAHCCRAACLSFNCGPRGFYLHRCIQHSCRNTQLQVEPLSSVRISDGSENGVREGICVRAPPICFQCSLCSTANV